MQAHHTHFIGAKAPGLWASLKEAWGAKYLLFLLVRRDFLLTYRHSYLGPLWAMAQPLMMALTFWFVFTQVSPLGRSKETPFLFYLAGLVPWTFFSQSVYSISESLYLNASLIGKVYFPRVVLPLAEVGNKIIQTFFQILTLVVLILLETQGTTLELLPLVSKAINLLFLFAVVASLALAIGFFLAGVALKWSDTRFVTNFGLQIWMYLTPVIYAPSKVPPQYALLLTLNPLAYPIDRIRTLFLDAQASLFLPQDGLYGGGSLILLLLGWKFFHSIERFAVDEI